MEGEFLAPPDQCYHGLFLLIAVALTYLHQCHPSQQASSWADCANVAVGLQGKTPRGGACRRSSFTRR